MYSALTSTYTYYCTMCILYVLILESFACSFSLCCRAFSFLLFLFPSPFSLYLVQYSFSPGEIEIQASRHRTAEAAGQERERERGRTPPFLPPSSYSNRNSIDQNGTQKDRWGMTFSFQNSLFGSWSIKLLSPSLFPFCFFPVDWGRGWLSGLKYST